MFSSPLARLTVAAICSWTMISAAPLFAAGREFGGYVGFNECPGFPDPLIRSVGGRSHWSFFRLIRRSFKKLRLRRCVRGRWHWEFPGDVQTSYECEKSVFSSQEWWTRLLFLRSIIIHWPRHKEIPIENKITSIPSPVTLWVFSAQSSAALEEFSTREARTLPPGSRTRRTWPPGQGSQSAHRRLQRKPGVGDN